VIYIQYLFVYLIMLWLTRPRITNKRDCLRLWCQR